MKKKNLPDLLLGGMAAALLAAVVGYNLAAAPRYDSEAVVPSSSESVFAPSKAESHLLVNINTATEEELQKLPGIGPVTAGKIVEYRESYGRFVDVYELDEVNGIGEKTIEKLLPYITV